jgi:hypothetical protein
MCERLIVLPCYLVWPCCLQNSKDGSAAGARGVTELLLAGIIPSVNCYVSQAGKEVTGLKNGLAKALC